jgi:hypothetical protein
MRSLAETDPEDRVRSHQPLLHGDGPVAVSSVIGAGGHPTGRALERVGIAHAVRGPCGICGSIGGRYGDVRVNRSADALPWSSTRGAAPVAASRQVRYGGASLRCGGHLAAMSRQRIQWLSP